MVAARYINRELLLMFTMTALVLLAVAVGGRFIGYLQDAAAGKYPAESLVTILGLRLPGFLQLLLPFSFYIAVLLTFGRLHADREMAVLQSAGVNPGRLFAWVAPSLIGLVGVTAWLSLQVAPANNAVLDGFLLEQRLRSGFEAVNPGQFNVFGRDGRVVYAETVSADRGALAGVFVSEYRDRQPVVTVWAETGRQYLDARTGSRFLVLENGRHYRGNSGARDYRVTRFQVLGQKLAEDRPLRRRIDEDTVPTATLWRRGDAGAAAELYWRLGLPVFCLVGALIAVGVARATPGMGRFARVVPGVLLLLLYYFAMLVNQHALFADMVPLWAGLWPVHLLFCATGAVLIARASRPGA